MKTTLVQACAVSAMLLGATAAPAQQLVAFGFTGTVQSISVPERAPYAVGAQVQGWFRPAAGNMGPPSAFIRVGDALEVSSDGDKLVVRELALGKVTTLDHPFSLDGGAYADYWGASSAQGGQPEYLGDYRWQFLNDPAVTWGPFSHPFSYLVLSYCLTQPWPYYETLVRLDSIAAVPEPSAWVLAGLGFGVCVWRGRRAAQRP